MKRTKIFVCGLVLLGLASVGRGEDPQNQQDNAQLRWRLERLESTIEELKKAAVAHAALATASNSAATATTPAADDEMKNLKQENAQLKQRLERLETALASVGTAETKKPDSAPVEPNNPAGAAKPQPVGTPVVAKDPTPPVQPQAAIAMGEVKNCGPSAQAQPASSPAGTKNSTPPVQPQAASAPAEVKSPAPSVEAQPASTPVEAKSATPSVQTQPVSAPAEVKSATPSVQAQPASTPVEAKSPTPSVQTQPVNAPAEVKSPTRPVQAQAASVTVEVQNSTPSVQPQAAIAMAEVKNCGPSAQAQPASSPAETKDSTPPVQAQAASASAEVKSPAPSIQTQPASAAAEVKSPAPSVQTQPASAPAEVKSPAPSVQTQPVSAPAEAKKPTDAPKPPAAAAPAASDKKNVLSSLDIEIYGIIKADASYDSSRTNPGNYVVYVDPEGTNKNDNEFNMTANQTRLGVRVGGPASDTLKTGGLIEFDFYGRTLASAPAENKAGILMRHAYLTLHWPKSQFSILAGQSWDIISPLNPNTLNYPVLWDAGNIGYRRPQIRFTQGVQLGEKTSMKFEGGVFRTIGRTDLTNSETGEDAGYPTSQGRVSVTFPFLGPKPTTVGVSGHIGQEEYDLNATGRNVKFEGWSLNLDVTLPVSSKLTVLGEGFCGRDLDQYFGGIGQGVNTTTRREIDAKGGWIAASLGPWSQWSYNVGAGIDRPDPDNLASGGRRQNSSIFGNVYYSFNKNVQFGVELSQWSTLYKGSSDADDTRVQTSFICKF